jgi:hypothetical protein
MNQIVNPIQDDVDLQNRRMMLARALGDSQTRAAPKPSGPLGITPVDYNAFSDNFFKFYKPGSQPKPDPQQTQQTPSQFERTPQDPAQMEAIYGQPKQGQLEHIYGSPVGQPPQNPGMQNAGMLSPTNATNYFGSTNSARGG